MVGPWPHVFVGACCRGCGEWFVAPEHVNQTTVAEHCSEDCKRVSRNRRSASWRRAFEAGATFVEPVDLGRLAARDQWRCHHCFESVLRLDWSIDHLVPLSAGGEHSYANTALAHVACNRELNVERQAELRAVA